MKPVNEKEQAANAALAQMQCLHTGIVEFSLGDSAAKELGQERVIQDNVPLDEANSIGSYIVGSSQPLSENDVFWDDRTERVTLDKTHGKHRLLLDLDVPHVYVASSSEGHGHLIIDCELLFPALAEILNVLGQHGILQLGFVEATLRRGETWLRAPGVSKFDYDTSAIAD